MPCFPESGEAPWHHRSQAEHTGSTRSNRSWQGQGPRGKEALPGERSRDWGNQALVTVVINWTGGWSFPGTAEHTEDVGTGLQVETTLR